MFWNKNRSPHQGKIVFPQGSQTTLYVPFHRLKIFKWPFIKKGKQVVEFNNCTTVVWMMNWYTYYIFIDDADFISIMGI